MEMYVASYNQIPHTQIGNYILGATYRATNAPGYIYTLNGKQSTTSNSDYYTGDTTIDYKGYNSMYAGKKWNKIRILVAGFSFVLWLRQCVPCGRGRHGLGRLRL